MVMKTLLELVRVNQESGCNSGGSSHTGDNLDHGEGATTSSPLAKRWRENDDSEDFIEMTVSIEMTGQKTEGE